MDLLNYFRDDAGLRIPIGVFQRLVDMCVSITLLGSNVRRDRLLNVLQGPKSDESTLAQIAIRNVAERRNGSGCGSKKQLDILVDVAFVSMHLR